MSYYNQREHALLDRKLVRELLLHLTRAHTMSSPTPEPRATHLEHLLRQTGSELERRWLRWLDTYGYRLPERAQVSWRPVRRVRTSSTRITRPPSTLTGRHTIM